MRLDALADSPRSFLARYETEKQYGRRRWRKEFRRGRWIIAYHNKKPIGMVGVTYHTDIPSQDRYIEYLWIDPLFRGTGTARAFVGKIVDELTEDQVGSVWLWVLDGNIAATRLYSKLGFIQDGEPVDLKDYPGLRETRMRLDLSLVPQRSPGSFLRPLAWPRTAARSVAAIWAVLILWLSRIG
jgi:RimJ/RimL family protein N-acetyltransferase